MTPSTLPLPLDLAVGAPARGDDRIVPITRLGVAALLLLAVVNGLYLFLVPARAEVDYAWSIQPSINAAFFGAGYLAGTVATALVVFRARSWRSLRLLPLPLVVLSITLLAATAIHADRFAWDYAPTWVWTIVYAAVPALVLAYWRLQERRASPRPAPDPRLHGVRRCSAVLGSVLALLGVALFVAPEALNDAWPWPQTPLTARITSGWYLLVASALLTAAWSLRRRGEAVIPYATLGSWSALLIALPALYADQLHDRPIALAAWVVIHLLLLALAAFALLRAVPALRSGDEHL